MELPQVVYTGPDGAGDGFLIPGPEYTLKASRGPGYGAASTAVQAGKTVSLKLEPRMKRSPGWYSGDNHVHTIYSDGSSTPADVVRAAGGEALDWITVTDHSLGPDNTHARRSYEEASDAAKDTRLVVLPGEEFTAGDRYHANVINGMVELTREASLEKLIDAVQAKNTDQQPMTVKWNHPGNGEGIPESELKRLPLVEVRLRDAENSQTMLLWWRLLNKGIRVFAESSSDSHSAVATRLGDHRTFVYLGQESLTAGNIVRALRAGRSFVSRGPLIFLRVQDGLPGSTVRSGSLDFTLDASSQAPMSRIEIIRGGVIFHTFDVKGQTVFNTQLKLPAEKGWYLARVIGEGGASPILALTNPVFVE